MDCAAMDAAESTMQHALGMNHRPAEQFSIKLAQIGMLTPPGGHPASEALPGRLP